MKKQAAVNSEPTTHNPQLLLRLFILTLTTASLFSCTPARKAIYFNNLQTGSDSIQYKILELTKRVQYGDRVVINIVTQDDKGNQLLNSGMSMFGAGGSGNIGGGQAGMQGGMGFGYLVDKAGDIELPIIGKFHIVGKAPVEITEMVREKVAILYKDPYVNTFISGRVIVLGDAGIQGSVPISNERLTVVEAVALSGVIDPTAHRDKVWLIREENGDRRYVQLDLNDRSIFTSPYFYLRNNDVLYVVPGKLPTFLKVNSPYLSAISIGTGLFGFVLGIIALTR